MESNATPYPAQARGFFDTEIRIARSYPHPRAKVWKALTEPRLVTAWLMRPENFELRVGCKFKLRAKPVPGWRGWVDCEVLAVEEQRLLRYSWAGDDSGKVLVVTWRLSDEAGGTKLELVHSGFTGMGGFFLAKLMMGPGWKKMMTKHMSSVLDRLGADGSFVADAKRDKGCW